MCSILKKFANWNLWKTLFLGQFLSLLICTTGIISQYIQNTYKIYIPTAQSFLTYCLLCVIFTTWLAFKPTNKGLFHVLKFRGWKYFLLAIIDVEANFVLVKAFQFTTLTSIQLLDCITIPTVLALSWIFIKVRFGLLHILGSCIALMGVGCLVWADIEDVSADIQAKNRFLGDMLCLFGAALYGISNVSEEYVVKCYSIVEFLGMIGLFGTIVNGIQLYFLEMEEILNAINLEKWQEFSLVIAFSMSLLLVYITMPLVLQVSSSAAVNISILSSDFYSLLIGIYLFNFKFHWLYFVSFGLVITGLIVYFLEPKPNNSTPDNPHNEPNIPINGNYHNLHCNTVITSSSTIDSGSTYNAFNSQYNTQSMSDLQNTYLTSVNVHSNNDFDRKTMT